MRNGRSKTSKPEGFNKAATVSALDLSAEAAKAFTREVQDVANRYHYNDSLMLRELRKRIAAGVRKRQSWAVEVAAKLKDDSKPRVLAS